MGLQSGARLGPYQIVSPLGAGGMGEVYRARDARLGRDVALKVLPEQFSRDPERMARFAREAQVLASLNHPNIAAIYGLEESEGKRALVMELVEGPTLAEKVFVAQGPLSDPAALLPSKDMEKPQRRRAGVALQVDEALPIARQIAEALEYAHERGIIHRDLKPANVKITPDGAVKVLDFGLAKALETSVAAASPAGTPPPQDSPTLSAMATQAGIILGTAAYMSPEQARGKPVDRRADIWAFGCVLYEMLAARQGFGGETVSDTLAAVLKTEPDWDALPEATPPAIQTLVRRCLTKDPRQRLRDIGEARIAIEKTLSGAPEAAVAASAACPDAGRVSPDLEAGIAASRSSPLQRALPWALVGALGIAAAIFAVGYFKRAPQPAPAVVSQILPPPGANFALGGDTGGPPALSPDGTKLAFAAKDSNGKAQLWVRPIDSAAAQPLAGTDGATFPFWSTDSRSLGFFANGKLNRIDASGGAVLPLCGAPSGRGGTWGRDGTILFTPAIRAAIYRVSASGGMPSEVTKLDLSYMISHRWPQFLPDGNHFLMYVESPLPGRDGTYVASVDGGEPKLLVRGASNAVYAPPGYLLFVHESTLMAQRFDADTLSLAGDPTSLAENASLNVFARNGLFTASENGALAYEGGGSSSGYSEILWFDRGGKKLRQTGTTGDFLSQSISPDGSRLAVTVELTDGENIWVFDLARNVKTRLTFSEGYSPAWSPDGKKIVFASGRGGLVHLYQKAADGTGKSTPLFTDDANEYLPQWSSDGRFMVFLRQATAPASLMETWALPTFGDRKPFPVLQSRFSLMGYALSPNGKWLAYVSPESGKAEVYVQPFPSGGGKWLVSTEGGHRPRWRRDGKELFYLSPGSKLMAAEISEQASSLTVGKVVPLFQIAAVFTVLGTPYDVTADGKEFVVSSQTPGQAPEPLTLIVNWPARLKN